MKINTVTFIIIVFIYALSFSPLLADEIPHNLESRRLEREQKSRRDQAEESIEHTFHQNENHEKENEDPSKKTAPPENTSQTSHIEPSRIPQLTQIHEIQLHSDSSPDRQTESSNEQIKKEMKKNREEHERVKNERLKQKETKLNADFESDRVKKSYESTEENNESTKIDQIQPAKIDIRTIKTQNNEHQITQEEHKEIISNGGVSVGILDKPQSAQIFQKNKHFKKLQILEANHISQQAVISINTGNNNLIGSGEIKTGDVNTQLSFINDFSRDTIYINNINPEKTEYVYVRVPPIVNSYFVTREIYREFINPSPGPIAYFPYTPPRVASFNTQMSPQTTRSNDVLGENSALQPPAQSNKGIGTMLLAGGLGLSLPYIVHGGIKLFSNYTSS